MVEVTQADDMAFAKSIVEAVDGLTLFEDKCLAVRDYLARHRTEAEALAKIEGVKLGIEAAARIAYRVCSETRHVSLGEAAYDSIRALDPATIAGADHDAT